MKFPGNTDCKWHHSLDLLCGLSPDPEKNKNSFKEASLLQTRHPERTQGCVCTSTFSLYTTKPQPARPDPKCRVTTIWNLGREQNPPPRKGQDQHKSWWEESITEESTIQAWSRDTASSQMKRKAECEQRECLTPPTTDSQQSDDPGMWLRALGRGKSQKGTSQSQKKSKAANIRVSWRTVKAVMS